MNPLVGVWMNSAPFGISPYSPSLAIWNFCWASGVEHLKSSFGPNALSIAMQKSRFWYSWAPNIFTPRPVTV